MLITNQLIHAKVKETITMSLCHYQVLVLLLAPYLLALDRTHDKIEEKIETHFSPEKTVKFNKHI